MPLRVFPHASKSVCWMRGNDCMYLKQTLVLAETIVSSRTCLQKNTLRSYKQIFKNSLP